MLSLLAAMFSCTVENGDTVRVMVSLDGGATVEGDNPVDVPRGSDVEFTITLKSGYVFKSVDVGEYNQATCKLKLNNVTKNTNVNFETTESDIDTSEFVTFKLSKGDSKDSSDLLHNVEYQAGTVVKLTAGNNSKNFLGWTVGGTLKEGGRFISASRTFSYALSGADGYMEDEAKVVRVCSNYLDADRYVIDSNGGTVDTSSVNFTNTEYYTASLSDGKVEIVLGSKYLSYMESASTFYDDGTFTKEGYVLKEYNTKADGSGESFSIGSKFSLVTLTEGVPTLYCIWAKDTEHTDFTYVPVRFNFPTDVTASKAPHWVQDGIMITEYTGNDRTVVIPETIDGYTVTAIDAGAFTNKEIETLVMGRRMLRVEDGAFVGCSSLSTVYYPDGLYYMRDEAFDSATYTSFKNLYVNATLAPRALGNEGGGSFATKLSRLISSSYMNRIIAVAGSSTYQGLGTRYMETLFEDEYRVINLGTTRTTNGIIYLEAMQNYAHEGDVILFAPENSAYMMGERELYWKTIRDLEVMNNFYRCIDISNYTCVFDSLTDYNATRYTRNGGRYEKICENTGTNKYGDCLYNGRNRYYNSDNNYQDVYYVTLNNRFKSRFDLDWKDSGQHDHADYTDLTDNVWCSIDDEYYASAMNKAIASAKTSGAKVYFGFCPVDADALVDGADSATWLKAYDEMIANTFDFDGVLGSSQDYVYDHIYFYDCAFHPNDYGRTIRTYQLYLDLCEALGITDTNEYNELGTSFEGCLFEAGTAGKPKYSWTPKNP